MANRRFASKECAAAIKDFAEVEQKKIDTERQRLSLESKVRQEEAAAQLAELTVLEKELELSQKLKEIGVLLYRTEDGNLTATISTITGQSERASERRLL